jgi:hypothetical protein
MRLRRPADAQGADPSANWSQCCFEKVGRLSLELDDVAGLLVRLRRRPNAFSLKIDEEPLLLAPPTVIEPPTREFVEARVRAHFPITEPAQRHGEPRVRVRDASQHRSAHDYRRRQYRLYAR